MATPVILFNNSASSDTQASGAGPSTALYGTADAEWSSLTFTLGDPMEETGPDLSGVATDGSHVIWADTSTGRKFFSISGKDVSAYTVTVNETIAGTSGLNWAIGGKRATLAGSSELYTGTYDVKPGWVYELGSGFTETFSGIFNFYGAGDSTNGPVTLRGESGGTRPILTWTNNGNCFIARSQDQKFKFLEFRNTNATKTSSSGLIPDNTDCNIDDLKLDHPTDFFYRGIKGGGQYGSFIIRNCSVKANDIGIRLGASGSNSKISIVNCYVHDCGGHGVQWLYNDFLGMQVLKGCIITDNGGDGVDISQSRGDGLTGFMISENTIDGNAGDGIQLNYSTGFIYDIFMNNIVSNNGGYGFNFDSSSQGSFTVIKVDYLGMVLDNNNTYSNTSGPANISSLLQNNPALDPTFTDSSAGDYSIGTNLKGEGSPEGNIGGGGSSTRSYVDIGAAQRQEAGGGGSPQLINGGLIS